MAWAIKFDGTNYATFPAWGVTSTDVTVVANCGMLPLGQGHNLQVFDVGQYKKGVYIYIHSDLVGGSVFVNNRGYEFFSDLTMLSSSYHTIGVRVTASLISLIIDSVVAETWAPAAGFPTFDLPCAIATPGHSLGANKTIMSLLSLSLEDNDNPSNNLYLDATASDHTNGGGSAPYPQPIIIDTVGGNDATGVGFPTNKLTYWHDLDATYGCTITVEPAKISGSVSGLVWLFTEGNFEAANAVGAIDGSGQSILNGGGNLRCYTDSTKATQLPIHVVTFQTGGTPKVQVWGRSVSLAVGGTVYIEADSSATVQPLPSNPYGQYAVWADYPFVTHDGITNAANGDALVNVGVTIGSTATPWGGDSLDFGGAVGNYLNYTIASLTEYHLSAWVNTTGLSDGGSDVIVYQDPSADASFLLLDLSPDDIGLYNDGDGWLRSGAQSTSVQGTWGLVSAYTDGSSRNVAVDGVVESTGSISPEAPRTVVNVGSRASRDSRWFYRGDMAMPRVASVAPDANKVAAAFNVESSPSTFWSTSTWEPQGGAPSTSTPIHILTTTYLGF